MMMTDDDDLMHRVTVTLSPPHYHILVNVYRPIPVQTAVKMNQVKSLNVFAMTIEL